jgi:type I restriction enzyme S subunit
MSGPPPNWKYLKIGEVAEVVSGATPKTKISEFWDEDILWATPKDLGQLETIEIADTERKITKAGYENCSTRLLPVGSVLLSSRAPIGHLAINTKPMCTNQGFKSLIPKETIFNRYLYWVLKASVPQLQGLGRGCTFDEISKGLVESYEIPVPPLDEQRRIVARIEGLTRRTEDAQKLRQKAASFCAFIRPSYIWKVVKQCEKNIWDKPQLGDKRIAKLVMGQSPSGDTYNRNQQGLPLLNGPTEFGDYHPSPLQWTTASKRQCKKGDILFCVRGSTTGRMNLADQIYSIGRGIAAIRPNTKNVLQEFLYSMIEIQVSEILHNAEGGVFPNFNKDQLSALTIPVPPMKEQKKIVEELVSLKKKSYEMETLQKSVIKDLESFQSALLAKAFRGEL